MKKSDYKFFFGWGIALFIATFVWCLIGELTHTTSSGLHIASGVVCAVCFIASSILLVIYIVKRRKIKE